MDIFPEGKGLCGALNTKQIKALINDPEWKSSGEDNRKLVTIGKKATEFATNNGIPVEKSFVGLPEGMTNFDALSTWRYATPHNIQRQTPQNASCDACHGNEALFLTADKVAPEELNANLPVIVDQIPPPLP